LLADAGKPGRLPWSAKRGSIRNADPPYSTKIVALRICVIFALFCGPLVFAISEVVVMMEAVAIAPPVSRSACRRDSPRSISLVILISFDGWGASSGEGGQDIWAHNGQGRWRNRQRTVRSRHSDLGPLF